MKSRTLDLNYYISGHGFGHATRAAKIIEALLALDSRINIRVISKAPSHLFIKSSRLQVIPQEVDSPVVQPQPYTIDASATFDKLQDFLTQINQSEWKLRTAELLEDSRCDMILADAPSPLAWLGHTTDILTVLVSNFGFDGIFEKLVTYLPVEEARRNQAALARVIEAYANFDYLVRLPGYIEFPFMQQHWAEERKLNHVIDAPLVFREPRSRRDATLKKLGIPENLYGSKILLVQFGGQLSSSTSSPMIPNLPEGWLCVLNSQRPDDERFFHFPPNFYLPDLVSASDAILGKFGYGTMSECVGLQKPLIYVRRPMFAEEPGLVNYMQQHGVCVEISASNYETGNWVDSINVAYSIHSKRRPEVVLEGSLEVAKIIRKILLDGRRSDLQTADSIT